MTGPLASSSTAERRKLAQPRKRRPSGLWAASETAGLGGRFRGYEVTPFRSTGTEDQRSGTKCRPPGKPAPSQRGTDQGMTERVYSSLASISIFTFPSSAPETGHPFLASSAALANAD